MTACIYCRNNLGMRPLDTLLYTIEDEEAGTVLEGWDLE